MNESERGQVSRSAAEVYDELFVPALFEEWVGRVADAAGIESGQKVLDVACGTGVLTRAVAERVGPRGAVIGLDLNGGMLAVARARSPRLEWRCAPAESLPFEDGCFDAVVSQFGLMFFADRVRALREIRRVLRSGGRAAIAVWATLAESPGYAAMADLLRRLFGDAAAGALHAPFALGEPGALRALFAEAAIEGIEIASLAGSARFPSVHAWLRTEIKGWVLADAIDDGALARLLREGERALGRFVTAEGTVRTPIVAHIVRFPP